ncbi:MAG: ABC transporter ATP-binding protein, partial [Anaerolineae bacterium]
ELKNVTKKFGGVVAVNNLSLKITDGEFFSLLGPSGCGKTTTLRMIAGFEQPTDGQIFIAGQPSAGAPPFERNTNMVFQNYALFPHMTVAQNVAFGLEMKRTPRHEINRRVANALEMVRLPGMENRRPNQLSGGQQQRVALARALVNRPQVLLLDEPLGALDLKLRKEMQLELKELQHRVGITFIYVTHDQEEALVMSDRIAVMHNGRALQVDTPANIYEHPASRFVADFIGETNFLEGQVTARDEACITVQVAPELTIRAPSQTDVPAGSPVTVALRPEKLHLQPDPAAGDDNCVRGVIKEVAYIGTDTHFLVSLAGDLTLKVRQQNTGAALNRPAYAGRRGDTACVVWSSQNVLLLKE